MKRISFLILLCVASAYATDVRAAMLYIDTAKEEFSEGDTFVAKLRIDNEGACINAADVRLQFPEHIKAIDVSRGDSIFTLWVSEPTVNASERVVSFSGGIPGGYCGRVAGDPGVSNVLASIIFTVPNLPQGETSRVGTLEFLPGTAVLLHDGFGTPAPLTTKGRDIRSVANGAVPTNDWVLELQKDTVPPEHFSIELRADDALFAKNYYIVFSTNDKQSGLDHFEVIEERLPQAQDGGRKAVWKRAYSPYMLTDQRLRSLIRVKAIDKAGNERVAEFAPSMPDESPAARLVALMVLLIILVFVIYHFITKKRALE